MAANSARNAQLAAIHIAKKDLHLDDDTYRLVIHAHTNGRTTSAAKMNDAERRKLLEHFEARGFRNPSRKPRRASDDPLAGKIYALWLQLATDRVVRDASHKALRSFVQRQTGVRAIEWLSTEQAIGVIEALKAWRNRGGSADAVS